MALKLGLSFCYALDILLESGMHYKAMEGLQVHLFLHGLQTPVFVTFSSINININEPSLFLAPKYHKKDVY